MSLLKLSGFTYIKYRNYVTITLDKRLTIVLSRIKANNLFIIILKLRDLSQIY